MKNNSLIITFLFLLSFLSFSQEIEKDLYLKHSVRQEGESYNFTVLSADKKGPFQHVKTKYYYWFKAQKVMSTQGGSSGLLLNGKFESFYDNKQLSSKGHFCKGLKDGEWLYWRENGSLLHVEHWKKGKLFGSEMFYDEKGNVTTTIDYNCYSYSKSTKDSLIVSNYTGTKKTITTFDDKGIVTSKKSFKEGKEVDVKKRFKISSVFKKDKTSKENNSEKNPKESKEKKDWFKFMKRNKGEDKPVKEATKKKEK